MSSHRNSLVSSNSKKNTKKSEELVTTTLEIKVTMVIQAVLAVVAGTLRLLATALPTGVAFVLKENSHNHTDSPCDIHCINTSAGTSTHNNNGNRDTNNDRTAHNKKKSKSDSNRNSNSSNNNCQIS